VSCKHACFDTQNNYAIQKKKKKVYNKDPCEFSYLYRTAPPKSLLEAPQPRNLRKTYHQP